MPHEYGVKIKCPFYLREAEKSITCEGIVDSAVSVTRFAFEAAKKNFQRANCERLDAQDRCELAKKLRDKY